MHSLWVSVCRFKYKTFTIARDAYSFSFSIILETLRSAHNLNNRLENKAFFKIIGFNVQINTTGKAYIVKLFINNLL